MFKKLHEQFSLLLLTLDLLDAEQYTKPIYHLSDATVGQHVRHCLEMVECLIKGKEIGKVDYVNRVRDLRLEQDINHARAHISFLVSRVDENNTNLNLVAEEATDAIIESNYYREIYFAIDHTIHHLALIKVGLTELGIKSPDANFGVSYATILYRESQTVKANMAM